MVMVSIVWKQSLRNSKRKYNDDVVREGRKLYDQNFKSSTIAKKLDISQGAVSRWIKNNFYDL